MPPRAASHKLTLSRAKYSTAFGTAIHIVALIKEQAELRGLVYDWHFLAKMIAKHVDRRDRVIWNRASAYMRHVVSWDVPKVPLFDYNPLVEHRRVFRQMCLKCKLPRYRDDYESIKHWVHRKKIGLTEQDKKNIEDNLFAELPEVGRKVMNNNGKLDKPAP